MPALRSEVECGEANYQDECPYPIKTLCTKCWAKETPKDKSLHGFASTECDYGARIVSSDGGQCSGASCGLHRLGRLRRFLHSRSAAACGVSRCHAGVWDDYRNLWVLVPAHGVRRVA